MSTQNTGPLAIIDRLERHLDSQECRGGEGPFTWSDTELQQPVPLRHLPRLGEVFQWRVGEFRTRSNGGREDRLPVLLVVPAEDYARIHLTPNADDTQPQLPYTD